MALKVFIFNIVIVIILFIVILSPIGQGTGVMPGCLFILLLYSIFSGIPAVLSLVFAIYEIREKEKNISSLFTLFGNVIYLVAYTVTLSYLLPMWMGI
jgi:hypothetical protein